MADIGIIVNKEEYGREMRNIWTTGLWSVCLNKILWSYIISRKVEYRPHRRKVRTKYLGRDIKRTRQIWSAIQKVYIAIILRSGRPCFKLTSNWLQNTSDLVHFIGNLTGILGGQIDSIRPKLTWTVAFGKWCANVAVVECCFRLNSCCDELKGHFFNFSNKKKLVKS